MRSAKVALAFGVVLLLLGFAAGTWQPAAAVGGQAVACAPPIDLNRLPFNELGAGPAPSPATRSVREVRRDAACRDATLTLRLVTWTALALGAVAVLTGWAALREQEASGTAGAGGRVRGPLSR